MSSLPRFRTALLLAWYTEGGRVPGGALSTHYVNGSETSAARQGDRLLGASLSEVVMPLVHSDFHYEQLAC